MASATASAREPAWCVARARPEQARALAALGAAALARGWSEAAVAAELSRDDAWTWVLRRAGREDALVGFLTARLVTDELHVLLVAVSPDQRRRGGGTALMAAALEAARRSGLGAVQLEVRAGNAAALALYTRLGFAAVGRRPRYYEGREDAVLMSYERLGSEESVSANAIRVDARVEENRAEGGANHRLRLLLPEGSDFRWQPGQFVMLSPGPTSDAERYDPLLPRPMAIYRTPAGAARGATALEILYKVTGRGTRLLADAGPGARVRVVGPLGQAFPLPARGAGALLVGGGTGIASLYELAAHATRAGPVAVLLGARSAGDLMGRGDFAALDVELRVATEDGSAGRGGLVTALLEEALLGAAAGAVVYACGPTPMMRAAAGLAAAAGRRCIVSLENHMACGFGVCLGCAVPRTEGGFALVCRDGPIFDADRVAWDDVP